MSGINRFYLNEKSSYRKYNKEIKCVFISHQKDDSNICRYIADYLLKAGIDVYFDEYDRDLKIQNQTNNPKGVVEAIQKGIRCSSHMLCVVSSNTINSQWVPWEVGYGYDKTDLRVLCLKGILKDTLPDFIKIVPKIRDIYDLNIFISQQGVVYKSLLESKNDLKYNNVLNPLRNYMDTLICD